MNKFVPCIHFIFYISLQVSCLCLQGMNLLKTLPESIRNSKLIPPREFDEKGTDNIIECLKEIRKNFVGESERNALNWWNEWEKSM